MDGIMNCHIGGYIFDNCRKPVRCLIFQDSFQKSIFDINQPKRNSKKEEKKKRKEEALRQGEKESANFVYTFRIFAPQDATLSSMVMNSWGLRFS